VARSVYVTAMEPGSGKSAVVLGLTEVLSRHAARMAFYRPFVASADDPDPAIELIRHRYRLPPDRARSVLSADDLHNFDGRGEYDALLKRILNGYAALADADVVVIEGSDFTEASLAVELDLNIDAASHLGSPVLLVVGGRRRSAEQVLDAVHQGLGMLAERGCVLLGVVCNRVEPELAEEIRAGVAEAAGGLPAAVMPEVPLLARPPWPRFRPGCRPSTSVGRSAWARPRHARSPE
jgi:phosphate acetyltransferase